jgi:hypothetical protein
MTDLFELIGWPGLALGLMAGGFGAYLLGVREPFFIGLFSVLSGIGGLALDLAWSRPRQRRRKVG